MKGCQEVKTGGPDEMGSIHKIWTEEKKTHKVVKLALLVLQIQARD